MRSARINPQPSYQKIDTMSATAVSSAVGPSDDDLGLFRAQGYLILPAVFPPATIERWRRAFLGILERQVASGSSNRGTRRYQTYLPFEPPFDEPELTANPRILATVRALLGDDCVLQLLGADTPLPGARLQTVHMDTVDLAPGARLPATYLVCVNVPLVDYTAENGPLELWPGTHLADLDIGGD